MNIDQYCFNYLLMNHNQDPLQERKVLC